MMVTDISGSMNATDVEPNRITAAVNSAKRLTDELPETFRLGLVTFSDFAEQRAPPSTDRSAVRGALDRLMAVGGTAMGLGLERGLEAARTPVPNEDGTGTRRLPAVLVLLSDGKNTSGGARPLEVAQRARRPTSRSTRSRSAPRRRGRGAGPVRLPPSDRRAARHRDAEGDRAASPAAASSRPPTRPSSSQIYANLGTRLSSKQEQGEVTVAFAGGALCCCWSAAGSPSLVRPPALARNCTLNDGWVLRSAPSDDEPTSMAGCAIEMTLVVPLGASYSYPAAVELKSLFVVEPRGLALRT